MATLLVAAVICVPLQVLSPSVALGATADDQALVGLINQERTGRGEPPLTFSPSISYTAVRHSADMARAGRLFHSCVDCIRSGHDWQVIGENIAYGATLRSVHHGLMQSTYHRENILCACFTHVAVGVVRSAGLVWVTEIFYRP
jgi:uncharacterized protein YkwD